MGESIDRTLGEDRIVKERNPLVDGAVAGDDGGGATVALEDHLIQIAGLLCVQTAQSKVVDDQNVGSQQTSEHLLGGVIGAGLVEALQEVIGA